MKKSRFFSIPLLALAALLSGCAGNALSHQVEELVVTFAAEPDPPQAGEETLLRAKVVQLAETEETETPVKDAQVEFAYFVFRDYQAEGYVTNLQGEPAREGTYTAKAIFETAGSYKVVVRVTRPGHAPVTAAFLVEAQGEQKQQAGTGS